MDDRVRSTRNELFQELKPICIEISQLAHKNSGTPGDTKPLLNSTKRLLSLLERKCRRTDGVFDEKLADYVFFPLSQILRGKQKYTDQLSEVVVNCLEILLEYGWRRSISLDLGKQLLILLTFVAGGAPGQEGHEAPEELVVSAYGALAALFKALSSTPGGASALIVTETVPALGHCMSTILDGVTEGPSPAAEVEALNALDALWRTVKDHETLSNFLPGTVSALTKSLMPGTANRKTQKVLLKSLEVLENVLVSTLGDVRCRSFLKDSEKPIKEISTKNGPQRTLTESWLKATAAQVKLSLINVVRLRKHTSIEVCKALNSLCLSLLNECHDTLADSRSVLVETCLSLVNAGGAGAGTYHRTSLADLAFIHADIAEAVRETVYNWVSSLPRVMQSNEEAPKHDAFDRLARAHRLLLGLSQKSAILEDALVASLRDSVTATLELSPPASNRLVKAEIDIDGDAAALVSRASSVVEFPPIIMAEPGQIQTRERLEAFLASLGDWDSQINIAGELLDYCCEASGSSLLSAYWLSAQISRSAASANKDLSDLLEPWAASLGEQIALQQEIFSYSQSILSDSSESMSDWRLQGIALEVIADTARQMKEGFCNELVDTLYIVTQTLGSPNSRLRNHGIICLNIIAKESGYANVSDLIVGNADYMINSISLKLDTFDISPQIPQVLSMLIRLTGPPLLSYLDDVVASIFAALDNFHGYESLVETLFSVLGDIIQVASASEQLLPIERYTKCHPFEDAHNTIEDIVHLIQNQNKKALGGQFLEHKDFPQRPWKDAKTLLDEADSPPIDEDREENSGPQEIQPTPPSKIYTMVQSIVRLGQHYLTNRSPVVRAKLLGLISIACRSLQSREDSFLPLINDIWPLVIKRLYDDEPFVRIAAAKAIAELCRGAGSFLTTRIQAEWNALMKASRLAKSKGMAEKKGRGGRGIFSQMHQVWDATIDVLVAIMKYVRVDDEMFDDVLELLADLLPTRHGLKDALSSVNADAVWLAMLPTEEPDEENPRS